MTSTPTVADVAAEAEFQLMVAKDYQVWLCALARAIHISYTHDGGRHADDLVGLVQFLDETNCGDIQTQIDQFHQIYKDHSAPQKLTSLERGAPPIDGPCNTVGERLVLARTWAGLTQTKLAKKIGIEQTSISQLERGESQRSTYIAELARACGVSTDWLAFGPGVTA